MKLEKITKRHYDDGCGTAHALDLIGERWALLVLRELLLGARRFGDLKASLPGISANVLTQRLEGLEASGIVRRRMLAPPASVQVYDLTEWGSEVEPIILALGRWGARSPVEDDAMPLSAVSMMLSFRAMFDPARAKGCNLTLRFHVGIETYTLHIRDGQLHAGRGADGAADIELSGPPARICGATYGLERLEDLVRAGTIRVRGDREAFRRFATVFAFPEKAARDEAG
jgi:DNA-binding HxlR family transcriptional regulator